MTVQARIGELLRRRQANVVERCKSVVLAENAGRVAEARDATEETILDRVPDLVEAVAQAIVTGGDIGALKTELSSLSNQLAEVAGGASELALLFLHLRAALYDELRSDWPEMAAEAWWPVECALDGALADAIRRSDALRAAKLRALEETVVAQSRLITMLGHDLRSSLNGISGFAQLVRREMQDAQHRRPIERILAIVGRMDRFIGDVLDLARARSGLGIAVCSARVDFSELCKRVVDATERANPGRLRLVATSGEMVDCDAERMSQVVANILANAVARSSETSPVDLRIANVGGDVTLVVRYLGPHMPQEHFARAFDPFRSDLRPADLGLCVAHEIAVAHRGTIEVSSAENGETTFTLRVPTNAG